MSNELKPLHFDADYTMEEALAEAKRCLNCPKPLCRMGCPIENEIPRFIQAIARGNFGEANDILAERTNLPSICGRVCPRENQCEGNCIMNKAKKPPINIGKLERFAADFESINELRKPKKIKQDLGKVAVVGSGPAGLSVAGDVAKLGYEVTVFEGQSEPGGVLLFGIPEFRLPKEIVQKEIDGLRKSGVKIETNMVIGRVLSVDELFEMGFEAVFIGTGAGLPRFMNIQGEGLSGVYSANEFLTRINLMKAYLHDYDTPINRPKSVAVIGGGNVAMDAARSAKRLGAEKVYIVYRRSEAEMPARLEEVHHAKEEGIIFQLLHNPVAIHGDEEGHVTAIECVKMELGEPDESGRRSPIVVEGSNFNLDVDTVIMAIGNSPNPLICQTTEGLEDRRGCIVVDEHMKTTRDGIYAGGDRYRCSNRNFGYGSR